ncbi:MAG: flagellar type III secretion system pore protein FliP [Planctomycetota bacterium]
MRNFLWVVSQSLFLLMVIDNPGVFAQTRDYQILDHSNFIEDERVKPLHNQPMDSVPESKSLMRWFTSEAKTLSEKEGTSSSIKLVLVLGILSLAPAILLMTTSYVRIVVVLTLLRQAFGGHQLPPNQVMTALSLFLTFLVMAPVWNEVKTSALDPYSHGEQIDWETAWNKGLAPIKKFMTRQIQIAGNQNTVAMLQKHTTHTSSYNANELTNETPINVLLPAFIISELKVAFLLGFQIFIPFLIVDFVVSSVTVSMGMMMLPPTMVSFPLKLILFVLVDGWTLVVGMLLQSFGPVIGG